jgi:uncharacterized Zn finger protein
MGRLDEAVGAAARHVTRADTLIAFASELMEAEEPGRIDLALDLVDGRLWEQEGKNPRDDLMLLGWLAHQYTKHGQAAKAFDLSRRRFDVAPSKEGYDALKAAARMPGQPDGLWERTRPAALKALRKQGGAGALIEIYLEEGDVAAAVKALEVGQKQKGGLGYGFATWWSPLGSLEARVAAAAETTDPDASIRIYRRMADRQIEARDRNHYRQAADHLAQIKRIMTTAGRSEQWSAHIAELRQQHKSLRALREELDALDLR